MATMLGLIGLFSWRMELHTVYLCIGGNLGDRLENIQETHDFISFNMGEIVAMSSVYESSPWEMTGAEDFLNQVVVIETELTPLQLLQEIQELEEYYGRQRKAGQYLSREMDVDILFWNDEVHTFDKLTVPHPRMAERRFVLVPLAEVAPEFIHPVLKKSVAALLADCTDASNVKKYASL